MEDGDRGWKNEKSSTVATSIFILYTRLFTGLSLSLWQPSSSVFPTRYDIQLGLSLAQSGSSPEFLAFCVYSSFFYFLFIVLFLFFFLFIFILISATKLPCIGQSIFVRTAML